MNKITILRKLIFETLLNEEIRLSKDSLDDQVDAILLRFETDCIDQESGGSEELGDDETMSFAESILREAPGDKDEEEDDDEFAKEEEPVDPEEAPADATDEPEEEEEPDLTTDDDFSVEEDSDPLQPAIDLHKFAGKVSRLATNYHSLLDMPIAIANRARNYLEQNYSHTVATEFEEILEREFDIILDRESLEEPREKPMAVGAGASGIGGV